MQLEQQELQMIYGGAITAALMNSIINGFKSLFNLGKSIGSTIARMASGRLC